MKLVEATGRLLSSVVSNGQETSKALSEDMAERQPSQLTVHHESSSFRNGGLARDRTRRANCAVEQLEGDER
jgi:hypothetical protein